jgi:hypothetical protein
MKDDFLHDETTDAEFDKWLAAQLKNSMVTPPEYLASKVVMKLDMPRSKGHIDPLMISILVGVLMINLVLLAFPHIIPSEWLQKLPSLLMLDTFATLSSVNSVIAAVVAVGLVFVGIDFVLSRKFGSNNITIA